MSDRNLLQAACHEFQKVAVPSSRWFTFRLHSFLNYRIHIIWNTLENHMNIIYIHMILQCIPYISTLCFFQCSPSVFS